MRFSDQLRSETDSIWRASADHPFLRELGLGTLDVERFKFYVRQDYLFLIEYSRVLALAVARSADLRQMSKFSTLLDSTLNVEMELHRKYSAKFGVTLQDLESTVPAPTTVAYTEHLIKVAYGGDLSDLLAALLPCAYGYYEHGRNLADSGEPVDAPLYAEWIRMYSSAEYAGIAEWLRSTFDEMANGLVEARRVELAGHYCISARYEYLFWDMAYKMEQWKV